MKCEQCLKPIEENKVYFIFNGTLVFCTETCRKEWIEQNAKSSAVERADDGDYW